MFTRFAQDARHAVEDSIAAARELGSPTIEAEHLLLAVTRTDSPAARTLAAHGLDFDGVVAALERETERSLAAVGVAAQAGPFSPWVSGPNFGTSAKRALERAARSAEARGDRRIGSAHLALGVLDADRGTVPRALEIAAVDRRALSDALR